MKKLIYSILNIVVVLFIGSCTTKDLALDEATAPNESQAEISMTFNLASWETTKTDNNGEIIPECADVEPGKAYVEIQKKENGVCVGDVLGFETDIIKTGAGIHKTKPFIVDAGDYEIQSVVIMSNTNPAYVIYSTVKEGADLAPFLPEEELMNKDITILPYTKPNIDVWVLCANNIPPLSFGMPIFKIQKKAIYYIPVFVNVCDEYGDHAVGQGVLLTKDMDGNLLYTTALTSGKIDYLVFADDLDTPDAEESFLFEIHVANHSVVSFSHTVFELKNTTWLAEWNNQFGFLHYFIDCGEDTPTNPTDCDECITPTNEGVILNFDDIFVEKFDKCYWSTYNGLKWDYSWSNGWSITAGPSGNIYDNKGNDNNVIGTQSATDNSLTVTRIEGKDVYMVLTPQYKLEKGKRLNFIYYANSEENKKDPNVKIDFYLVDKDGNKDKIGGGTVTKGTIMDGKDAWRECEPDYLVKEDGCFQLLIKVDFNKTNLTVVKIDDITLVDPGQN